MNSALSSSKSRHFRIQCRRFCRFRTHSCRNSLWAALPHHPKVGEHEERIQLCRVLGQATVAHLGVSELAFDHPERVLYLGTDAGLELFDLVRDRIQRIALIQCPAFSDAHGHMPVDRHVRGFFTLANTLIPSVCINVCLLPVHQRMGLGDVIDVGCSSHHRMNQTRFGVRTNVGFHSVMPRISLLGLVHLWVTLSAVVLGRTGCRDDGGIDDSTAVQHQAPGFEHGVDGLEELLGQIVLFQQVTETQDADPIGHSGVYIQSSKVPVQRCLEQGFFHGEVAQAEELLKQIKAQHGLVRKGWTPSCLRWRHRRELRNKLWPRNNAVHQFQQFHLARAPRAQVRPTSCCCMPVFSSPLVAFTRCDRRSFEHFP